MMIKRKLRAISGEERPLYNLLMYPGFFNRFNRHDFAISGY
jgi:hypothetical protein